VRPLQHRLSAAQVARAHEFVERVREKKFEKDYWEMAKAGELASGRASSAAGRLAARACARLYPS
jgi:hypothetical protein